MAWNPESEQLNAGWVNDFEDFAQRMETAGFQNLDDSMPSDIVSLWPGADLIGQTLNSID